MEDHMGGQQSKSSGCLKFAVFGCGVVAALAVIGGIVLYYSAGTIARRMGSKAAVAVLEAQFKEMGFPDAEKEAILTPVREFAQKVKDRKVTGQQIGCVFEQVTDKKIVAAAIARAFGFRYLEPSQLSTEEKEKGRSDLRRFTRGVLDGEIPEKRKEEVLRLVTEENSGAPGNRQNRHLKKSLTTEEIRKCLGLMREAADTAKIAATGPEIDLADEIRKAIDRGMKGEHNRGAWQPSSPSFHESKPESAQTRTDEKETTESAQTRTDEKETTAGIHRP